jgi:hypothetical protein
MSVGTVQSPLSSADELTGTWGLGWPDALVPAAQRHDGLPPESEAIAKTDCSPSTAGFPAAGARSWSDARGIGSPALPINAAPPRLRTTEKSRKPRRFTCGSQVRSRFLIRHPEKATKDERPERDCSGYPHYGISTTRMAHSRFAARWCRKGLWAKPSQESSTNIRHSAPVYRPWVGHRRH